MVALTSTSQLARLRVALEPAFHVHHVRDFEGAEAIAREQRPCVFFVSPTARGEFDLASLAALAKRHGPRLIVLYAAMRRPTMASLACMRQLCIETLLLEGDEDSMQRIRLVTEDVAAEGISRALLARLPGGAEGLIPQFGAVLEQLVRFPRRFRIADDLAHEAKTSLRTLYRRFGEIGLASPRVVLISVRLLRAHWHMRELGMRPSDSAKRLRYASTASLIRQCRELVGMSPRTMSLRLTCADAVKCIATILLSKDGANPAPAAGLQRTEPRVDRAEEHFWMTTARR